MDHLKKCLKRKEIEIKETKNSIKRLKHQMKTLKSKLKIQEFQKADIKYDLEHPYKKCLWKYFNADLMDLCISYLPTWCNIHENFFRGTRCIHCLTPGENWEEEGEEESNYRLVGDCELLKLRKLSIYGDQQWYLVAYEQEDIELFKEWSSENIDHQISKHEIGRTLLIDFINKDIVIEKECVIELDTIISFTKANYVDGDYDWETICDNATSIVRVFSLKEPTVPLTSRRSNFK